MRGLHGGDVVVSVDIMTPLSCRRGGYHGNRTCCHGYLGISGSGLMCWGSFRGKILLREDVFWRLLVFTTRWRCMLKMWNNKVSSSISYFTLLYFYFTLLGTWTWTLFYFTLLWLWLWLDLDLTLTWLWLDLTWLKFYFYFTFTLLYFNFTFFIFKIIMTLFITLLFLFSADHLFLLFYFQLTTCIVIWPVWLVDWLVGWLVVQDTCGYQMCPLVWSLVWSSDFSYWWLSVCLVWV